MKKRNLLLFVPILLGPTLFGCNQTSQPTPPKDPWENVVIEKGINFHTTIYERSEHETIDILIEGYGAGNSVGIFARDSEPGSKKGAIKRKAIKNDNKIYSFNISDFKQDGEYNIFLFNKDTDIVYDYDNITILAKDTNDYKISNAEVKVENNNNTIKSSLSFETTHLEELTYEIYWAKDNIRLPEYTWIERIVSKDQSKIEVLFNDNMIAPTEANQIEITVLEGRTTSYFVSIPETYKITDSEYLNSLQVFSDVHVESPYTCSNYNSHFISNLNKIKNSEHETSGIVFVGDFANSGHENNYKLFYEHIDSVFETRPNLYPVLGNHELQYWDVYEDGLNEYKKNTGMPGAYFSFEIGGFKCFALGSEDTSTHGLMTDEQFSWFENQMKQLDKKEKIMIFMHQGIYNTVSGTLPGHGWHGFRTQTDKLRNLIKQYPNAFVFSGHSHQSLDCVQTSLFGHGLEANYVNCGASAYVLDDNRDEVYGSSGYFLEVYEDYLMLKGRLSIENKWISAAQFVVPFVK